MVMAFGGREMALETWRRASNVDALQVRSYRQPR